MVSLSARGASYLENTVREISTSLPGCFLSVASESNVLFSYQYGWFDVLRSDGRGRRVEPDSILWLSSATRFVIALAYLQLVDKGVLSMDAPLKAFSKEFETVSSTILTGFDAAGNPTLSASQKDITLRMMLNGTSGFSEFSELTKEWKRWSSTSKNPINGCQVDDLIYIPPVQQPGEQYAYSFSADWLAYLLPSITRVDLESYLKDNIFDPLGMGDTTFFPFDEPLVSRLMPLRFINFDGGWEEFRDQMPVHKMPRSRREIEYPNGSGLYTTARDFIVLLQNVLRGNLCSEGRAAEPAAPLLSEYFYRQILSPCLTSSAVGGLPSLLTGYFNFGPGEAPLEADDVSTCLGDVPVYTGHSRRSGWGRESGTVGWGGAAGTDFYIDPKTGIAVYFTSQMLPGSGTLMKEARKTVERAVYHALTMP